MSRKGISPIIAAVLLVAVSLSVVAIFSGWAPNLAQTITEDTTNSTLQTLDCEDASIDVQSAYYNSSANETTVRILNNGRTDLSNLIVGAFDSNELLIEQKSGVNFTAGEHNDTVISEVDQKPSYVQAFSQECGSVQNKLETINQ